MRSVEDLIGKHDGEDIYILGTGASVRVFPLDFLKNKISIGLNMAWKLADVKYCITTRPELNVPEFLANETPHPEITWITKYEKLINRKQRDYGAKNFYMFSSDSGRPNTAPAHQPSDAGRVLDWVRTPTTNKLYLWASISATAANLAANMGARSIILVGCDNCSLGGNHHAHQQHTLWKGVDPLERYEQYYSGLVEVRRALRERNVNMMSLTPFLSLLDPDRDFKRLCEETDKPAFIDNNEIDSKGSNLKVRIRDALKIFKIQ